MPLNIDVNTLVPSSFALRYFSVIPSLYLRYASIIPPLYIRFVNEGRSSSQRRMIEFTTVDERRTNEQHSLKQPYHGMKRPYHDLIQSYHAMIRRFFPSMIHENIRQDQQPICHFCYFPYETGYRQTLVLQYVFLPCVQTYQELQQPL